MLALIVASDMPPTTTLPKFSDGGEKTTLPGATPVPVSAAAAGLPVKLPPMLSVPDRVPVAAGLKLTCRVQLLSAPSDPTQLVDCREKSPVMTGACRVTAAPPELVAVKVAGGEVAFRTTWPKSCEDGTMARVPGVAPVPLSAAVAGLAAKLPGTESDPLRLPMIEGVNSTSSLQLDPAASEVPQVVDAIAKSPLAEGVPSVTGAPPLFAATKVADADVVPSTTIPKLSPAGESARLPGDTPVPDKDELAGLVAKLPAMLSAPVRKPVADGVKVTWTTQLPPAGSDAPQLVDRTAKSPLVAGAWRLTAVPPLLLAVKAAADFVAPTTTAPKVCAAGESVRLPGVTPCPVSAAVAGLLLKVPPMLSTPLRLPRAVGEKVTKSVQLAPAASAGVQVVEATAKSPLAEGVCRLTGAPPVFRAVMVAEVEVDPSATEPKL